MTTPKSPTASTPSTNHTSAPKQAAGPILRPVLTDQDLAAAATAAGVDRAPAQGAPHRPVGFTPLTKAIVDALHKPLPSQVSHAVVVAGEVQALGAARDWQQTFGTAVPSGTELAASLQVAADWDAEAQRSREWDQYVQAQRHRAWDHALTGMASFEPALMAIVQGAPALANSVKATTAFVGDRKVLGQRGATTRTAARHTQQTAAKASTRAVKAQHRADLAKLAETQRAADLQPPTPVAPTAPAPTTTPGPAH